jgi:hypothetical protein
LEDAKRLGTGTVRLVFFKDFMIVERPYDEVAGRFTTDSGALRTLD